MRLIDADKLEPYRSTIVQKNSITEAYWRGARDVFEYIDSMPTVDAIPVIRCKYCQSWKENECNLPEFGWCGTLQMLTHAGDHCAWSPNLDEEKDEYVTLHHEDIHFIDEDAERTFYESLAARKNNETD